MNRYDIVVFMNGEAVFDSRIISPDDGCDFETAYNAVRSGYNCKETCEILKCKPLAKSFGEQLGTTAVSLKQINDILFGGTKFGDIKFGGFYEAQCSCPPTPLQIPNIFHPIHRSPPPHKKIRFQTPYITLLSKASA